MPLLYNIGAGMYHAGVKLAAPFNKKAEKWVQGRKGLIEKLEFVLKDIKDPIWIHASSLGEFEQGRPIIDALKNEYPKKKILLTFFSPSGMEVVQQKEKDLLVFYLPADTAKNAQEFLRIVKPCVAIFVKYEFWYHYLKSLNDQKVPTFIVSAIFRRSQPFFKWYGGTYRKMLGFFATIFVQDKASVELLKSIGVENVELSGDTRFDRVTQIVEKNERSEILEAFVSRASNVLVAGSTWPKDEELIANFFDNDKNGTKLIIAPHEVHQTHIEALKNRFKDDVLLWSDPRIRKNDELNGIAFNQDGLDVLTEANILIIDTIGILSRTYKYGTIAYIGGGFGNGIHNVLEAAAYGLPIQF